MSLHGKTKEELKGTVVKCTTNKLKYVQMGELYLISSGNTQRWRTSFTLKGIKGTYTPYNFEEVPAAIMRDMQIESIFGDTDEILVTTKKSNKRKVELITNRTEELFKLIIRKICGYKKRNWKMTTFNKVVDDITRGSNILDATKTDYEELRHMTLEQILDNVPNIVEKD